MTTTTWTLNINHKKHTVCLNHGTMSGKRQIWVDGKLVEEGKQLFDSGSRHLLSVDDHVVEVLIYTNGVTFSYFLLDELVPIPSDKQAQAGKTAEDLLRTGFLRDVQFWNELRKLLGLAYQPLPNALWAYRHRLIGLRAGYMVLIEKTVVESTQEAWQILVRHASLDSFEEAERMYSDSRVVPLLGKLAKKSDIVFGGSPIYTTTALPIVKHESPAEFAMRVQTFLAVVATYTRPLQPHVCENPECLFRDGSEPKWVIVNGIPAYYCPGCISEIPGWAKQAKEEYIKAPGNLAQGVLVGIGAALVGAILWSALAIFFTAIAIVIPAVILAGLVKEMDQVGTKRTYLSLAVATLLTLFSVTLGAWITQFLLILREGAPISLQTFTFAWQYMLAQPANLKMAYLFTALGAGWALFSLLSHQKTSRSEVFKPDVVEVRGVA